MPQCWFCVHFDNKNYTDTLYDSKIPFSEKVAFRCAAFPQAIPNEIQANRFDHREQYPNDNEFNFKLPDNLEILRQRLPFHNIKDTEAIENWLKEVHYVMELERKSGYAKPVWNEPDKED